VLAAAVAMVGCYTETTIPEPFVRPGAPIFYLKIQRESFHEETTIHGPHVSLIVHSTIYTAVDLATCRELGTKKFSGDTWEEAWDPDGDDLWVADYPMANHSDSFRGRQAHPPGLNRYDRRWEEAGTLRVARWSGPAPAIWDFHSGKETPIPGGDAVLEGGGFYPIPAGPHRLAAFAAGAGGRGEGLLVVADQGAGDAPPIVARWPIVVEGRYARPVAVSPDGTAVVLSGAPGALEAFDLRDGHALWKTNALSDGGLIGGGRSPVLGIAAPSESSSGRVSCSRGLDLIDVASGALVRKVVYPWCVRLDEWVDGGRFLLGSAHSADEDGVRGAFDTEIPRMIPLPASASRPVSTGGTVFFRDGPRDGANRLFHADFAGGAEGRGAVAIDGHSGDIRFVAPDRVSGTVVVSGPNDEVLVYRPTTGRLEKCLSP
jgi:hypothetical protein